MLMISSYRLHHMSTKFWNERNCRRWNFARAYAGPTTTSSNAAHDSGGRRGTDRKEEQ